MIKNEFQAFFILITIIFCLPTYCCAGPQAADLTSNKFCERAINNEYLNYRIVGNNDLDVFSLHVYENIKREGGPTVVTSDFDNNGFIDCAALLFSANSAEKETLLSVLFQESENKFSKHTIHLWKGHDRGLIIDAVQKGAVLEYAEALEDDLVSKKINATGIRLTYIGKSAVVYYWNASEAVFKQIWIAD